LFFYSIGALLHFFEAAQRLVFYSNVAYNHFLMATPQLIFYSNVAPSHFLLATPQLIFKSLSTKNNIHAREKRQVILRVFPPVCIHLKLISHPGFFPQCVMEI
jgi:hypothetical protein